MKDAAQKTATISISYEAIVSLVKYPVYIGSTQVTNANKDDVLGSNDTDGNISYNATTKTLTLNNTHLNSFAYFMDSENTTASIYADDDLNIVLIGTNSVEKMTYFTSYAIYVYGNLTVSGSGSLSCLSEIDSNAIIYGYIGVGIRGTNVAFNGGSSIILKSSSYAVLVPTGGAVTVASGAAIRTGDGASQNSTGTVATLKTNKWASITR